MSDSIISDNYSKLKWLWSELPSRNRVHQLEKLCNDHISNLNEYDKEIEALIETVSELGKISIFNYSQ